MTAANAEGTTLDFVFMARSHRHAKQQARAWVARSEWATTLVGITPIDEVDHISPVTGRRLLAVAGATFAVAGITLAGTAMLALRLEGAL